MQWCRFRRIGIFSVPNGFIAGGRSKHAGIQKLKNEGMLKGAPDLILMNRCPKSGRPIAIEMKRKRGGELSPEQEQVIAQMRLAGWIVIVAEGYDHARRALISLGF